MSSPSHLLAVFAASALASTPPAAGAPQTAGPTPADTSPTDAAPPPTAKPEQLSCPASGSTHLLVMSGGTSLGNYQAGQLWVVLEYLQRCNLAGRDAAEKATTEARDRAPLDLQSARQAQTWQDYNLIVVGTSAGAVNTTLVEAELLTNPTTSADEPEDPVRSLPFIAWTGIGFGSDKSALGYRDPEGTATALLSRIGSDDDMLAMVRRPVSEDRWKGGLTLGVTATAVAPFDPDPLNPYARVQFVVKKDKAAPGQPLRETTWSWQQKETDPKQVSGLPIPQSPPPPPAISQPHLTLS
jgi:hypothetical protein